MRIILLLLFMAASAAAQPATRPTTATATQPATRANPLADPTTAVQRLLDLLKQEDFDAARGISLHSVTASEMRRAFGEMIAGMRAGGRSDIVETHRAGTVAVVVCRWSAPQQRDVIYGMISIQRYDEWKVQVGVPNARKMTEGERENLEKLTEKVAQRVKELEQAAAASTQPAKQ